MATKYQELSDTEKRHLTILADAFFANLTVIDVEFGGIGLDCKRPFGNSSVESDILELIEVAPDTDDDYSKEQREYARKLYFDDLIPFLQNNYAHIIKP